MPNWCCNNLQITGKKEDINRIEEELAKSEGKNFFDIFVEPTKEDNADWYTYNLENYGCKWNCDADEWWTDDGGDMMTITISFQSPWGPPIALYEKIDSEGMSVYAQYLESGMCFVGEFANGCDECYEYDNLESLDQIPEELVDSWGLREMLEEEEEFDREIENSKD